MSLPVGQRMVRADDGMKGTVELVTIPGFEHQEPRITYVDRGEKRIAGKREVWEPVKDPPRQLLPEEIERVAAAADTMLRNIDHNELFQWWKFGGIPGKWHDDGLRRIICDYLRFRG